MYNAARYIASVILRVFEISLVLRCILSWIPGLRGSKFDDILYSVTEPVVGPVRNFIYRLFPALRSFPLDLSVLIVFMLISTLQNII